MVICVTYLNFARYLFYIYERGRVRDNIVNVI